MRGLKREWDMTDYTRFVMSGRPGEICTGKRTSSSDEVVTFATWHKKVLILATEHLSDASRTMLVNLTKVGIEKKFKPNTRFYIFVEKLDEAAYAEADLLIATRGIAK